MALPPAIIRRTVTYGPETDFQGNPVTGTVTFTPSQSLTWGATGQGLHVAPISVPLDVTGSGSVSLVCTDQTGLFNIGGDQVTNWIYSVSMQLRMITDTGSVPITSPPTRFFQVPQGDGPLDLDNMVAVTSSTGIVVLVPAITNLAGLSGPTVTLEQLNALGLGGGGGGGTYTTEQAQDAAALLLTAGGHSGIAFTYDDAANRITAAITGLATVATSGAYADLTGKPTIPAATTDASQLTTGTLAAARLPSITAAMVAADVATQAELDAVAAAKANTAHAHTSANISDFTEAVQDAVAGLLGAGSNVILTYDDTANTLTVSATGAGGTGLDAEQVRDAIGVALVGVGNIAVVVNDAADTITISTTATANATDASLRDRSTHTGTQAAGTITGLATVATSGSYADLSSKPSIPAATASTALSKFYGAAGTRDGSPVIVLLYGDSYTASSSWSARFRTLIQAELPRTNGQASPANTTDVTTGRGGRGSGVQIVNMAQNGQTTVDFTDATRSAQAASLRPALYILMLGANDVMQGITPTQHKANIQAEIAYQKANNPWPFAFVLVHAFPRQDIAIPGGWDAYGQAELEIAIADPSTVVYVDIAPVFAAVGIPGSNPFVMLQSDNLHPNDAGALLMGDLIWDALKPTLGLNVSATIGAVTPVVTKVSSPVISGTAITGSTLTTTNGTWLVTPDSYTYAWKRAGTAISGATASTYVLQVADEGQAIACTVTAVKAGYTSGTDTSNTITPTNGSSSMPVADNFNRADDNGGMNTASDGVAWQVFGGAYQYLSGNGGVAYEGGGGVACREVGAADFTLQTTMVSGPSGTAFNTASGPAFRVSDGFNYWVVVGLSGGWALRKNIGGTVSTPAGGQSSKVPAFNDVVKVVTSGSTITLFINGTQEAQVTDSYLSTATKVGLASLANNGGQGIKIDNLTVTIP